jgi:hypothetical protein
MRVGTTGWLKVSLVSLAACWWVSGLALANEKKADATGTWKWSLTRQDGTTVETTLKLKQDGDKLSGVVIGPDGKENKIEEAKIDGDEISFQVTRERKGEKRTAKFHGKVKGDTIKGKMQFGANSRDWEATRAKD